MVRAQYVMIVVSLIGLSMNTLKAQQKCVVIAHRGASGYAPENSIAAFKKAVELGVDMIELDVHQCASGEVVVIHDDTLDRTTNGTGYIKNKTKEQLDALTLQNSSEQIPTLQEVIDVVGRSVKIAIELKGPSTALPTAHIIQEYLDKGWQAEDFYVLSFDHPQLQEFHALLPQIKRCANISCKIICFPEYALKHNFTLVATSYDCATKEFIDAVHAYGLKIFVYTVNDSRIIEELLALGVDGIFSDYPDRVQVLLK